MFIIAGLEIIAKSLGDAIDFFRKTRPAFYSEDVVVKVKQTGKRDSYVRITPRGYQILKGKRK